MERFSQELTEAIEAYMRERHGDTLTVRGLELDDVIPAILDQLEEHLSELEDMIDEAVSDETA